MKYTIAILFFLGIGSFAFAQKVDIEPTISPDFFAADEEITITYDVTGTTLSTLDEAWLWLWLPDNTDANIPSNANPAKDNASVTDAAKFELSNPNGKTVFSISLTLTEFTNLSKDQITNVGMLIKGNDWGDGQSEDYVTSVTTAFTVEFVNPSTRYAFFDQVQTLDIQAKCSATADLSLTIDDVEVSQVSDATSISYSHTLIDDGELHTIKVIANTGTESDESIYSYGISPSPDQLAVPAGQLDGVNYNHANETEATLVLTAPGKSHVFVIGDFNDWTPSNEYLMHADGDRFWLTLEQLTAGKEYVYQYLIDGELNIADPYTDKVSDPWDDHFIDDATYPDLIEYPSLQASNRASVLQTGQTPYIWKNADFAAPDKEDLVIYELLIRDFDDAHTYQSVMNRLDYLEGLGINVLELMPVNEFEGNESWGYNPNFFFAPDKYYGTKNDLKALIDECHSRGIAVIIDMVLNHSFNSSPMARMYWNDSKNRPASDSPWYNEEHNFQTSAAHWGSDFNHESDYMKAFVDSVNTYWIQEYKVDGFRFDFTKGFGNNYKSQSSDEWGSKYDAGRIALLKRMADKIWAVDDDSYVIFEHLAENSEETELANYGIMLWGNMNHDYRNVGKSLNRNLEYVYHETRGWNEPNLVGYMESHDEERQVWDLKKSMSLDVALKRAQLNTAFFLTVPGPKMIWQFGERGYDEELNNDRLGKKPPHWEYLEDENRKKLFDVYTALANLKTKSGYINSENFTWSADDFIKWITIDNADVDITIVGNFGREAATTDAHFTSNGTWYNYLTDEEVEVTDYTTHEITLSSGGFYVFTSEKIENYISADPTILSADHSLSDQLQLFPNPVSGMLNLSGVSQIETLTVLDIHGRKINNQPKFDTNQSQADMSGLKPGMYLLQLTTSKGLVVKRFIKN